MHQYTSVDAKFDIDSEFEVQILYLPTHSGEKRRFKNLLGLIQKFLIALHLK